MAMYRWIDRNRPRRSRETGQTMAEYAVVLGVITPAVVLALTLLNGAIVDAFNQVVGLFS